MKEREEKTFWTRFLLFITMVMAGVSLIMGIFVIANRFQDLISIEGEAWDEDGLHSRLNSLEVRMDELYDFKSELESITKTMKENIEYLRLLPKDTKLALRLSDVEEGIALLSLNLKKINDIILHEPHEALSIPFLKNEIEVLEREQGLKLSNFRDEMNRFFSQYNLLIIAFLTLAAAMVGVLINLMIQLRRPSTSKRDYGLY